MSRRWFPAILILVTAILMLGVALEGQAFEVREGKKILVFGARQAVPNLDPHVKTDWSTRTLQQSVYDALLKYEGNPPKLTPWLAESYSSSKDGKTYTFKLNPKAKFHTGEQVTAYDVKFSFERILDLKLGPAVLYMDVVDRDSLKVVDMHTVQVSLKKPYAPFIATIPWLYIVSWKQTIANIKDNDYAQKWLMDHEAGSGPFKIRRWEQGNLYELEAVENYWKGWKSPKHIGGYIFKLIQESASQRIALLKGEADLVEGLASDDYDNIAKTPGIKIEEHPGVTNFAIKFNNQKGLTANKDIRKAVSYAMDYDAFIKIYNGHAVLMEGVIPKAFKEHAPKLPVYRQDMAKAKEHLAKAGYPNGGFSLEYVYVAGLEEERLIGLVLLDQLKKLNITVSMVALPWPQMVARGSKIETMPDMMAVFVTPQFFDPDAILTLQFHSGSWGRGYYSVAYYKDPKVDALIDEARSVTDWPKREKMYFEIQRLLVEDAPELWGMLFNRRWAMRLHVKGFLFSPVHYTGEVDMYQLTIQE
jgi:peptide/nickel transport system substrate-binding protein